jgi:sigma-B regulation protein RsbU (phosphoserine phosphatase)
MRDELADARKIQLSMLPDAPPAVPWIDLSALSLPASEVGGDFFDYLELPGERMAVVVGDVAGHGVAAALVLAAVKSGLHLLAEDLSEPVAVLERLDRMVRMAIRWRLFVTLLVAVFEPGRDRVRVVSAGHPPALLLSADGAIRSLGLPALPLGTRLPARFREESAAWRTDDLLVLYSDGVTELADGTGEGFGSERLERALRRSRQTVGRAGRGSARAVRESLFDALFHFKGDAAQRDDVTMVVVRRPAPKL